MIVPMQVARIDDWFPHVIGTGIWRRFQSIKYFRSHAMWSETPQSMSQAVRSNGPLKLAPAVAVPRFGAGGLRMPSPTPSASGSVAGGGAAGAVSRHDAAKVPRLGVAESVADEAVAELVEWVTGMSCDPRW